MRNSNIGSSSASNIVAALIHNRSLETLDLGNNQIGDQACGAIAKMIREKQGYERLTLVLRCNQISKQGYEKLKEALLHHHQDLNTRREFSHTANEDLKVQLGGNPISIRDFQAALDSLGTTFASLLLL